MSDLLNLIKSDQEYVNVHTTQNPPGEVRGQIPESTNTTSNTPVGNPAPSATEPTKNSPPDYLFISHVVSVLKIRNKKGVFRLPLYYL